MAAPLLLLSKSNMKQSRKRNLETIVFPGTGSTAKPAEVETENTIHWVMLPFEREEEEGGGRRKNKKKSTNIWKK